MTEPVTAPAATPAAPPAAPAAPATSAAPATLLGGGAPESKPGAPASPATPAPAEDPYGFSPEERGFYENKAWLKDGKLDVKQLAKGYMQLEGFRGVPGEELFRLSKSPTADELSRLDERRGVPKDATGYGLQGGEGTSADQLARLGAAALKARATPEQLKAFIEFNDAELKAAEAAEAAADAKALRDGGAELQRDWGQAFKKNQNIALGVTQLEAFKSEGLDDEGFWAHAAKYPGMSPAKIARALYKLGVGLGEDKFISDDGTSGGLRSPESAQARRDEIMNNPEQRKALLNGTASQALVDEWNGLASAELGLPKR